MEPTLVTASVLHGAKDLRLDTRELPRPEADEVQVAVRATGLCGSDLHYFQHYRNGDILVREPLTLGHESSGVVTAIGSGVSTLAVGDRVALEVGLPCEACDLCDNGRYNICREMKFRSSGKYFPHAQGTLQERINHPARWCHKLPGGISMDFGALMEPMGVAIHARDRANLPMGSSVVIFGAGAVGLLVAAVMKASGAKSVIICDILESRVSFATDRGFADAGLVVPSARPDSLEGKLEYTRGIASTIRATSVDGKSIGEVDAVFECTGVESCVQAGIFTTRPGGKVMLIGMGNPVMTLQMSAAALREVDLVGVFRYAGTYPKAIELLTRQDNRLPDLTPLITHRFRGMGQIANAFAQAGQMKDSDGNLVIKVLVDMEHS